MIKKRRFVFTLLLLHSYINYAQKSAQYTNELIDFQKALSLYNDKQYLAAQSLFYKVKNNSKEELIISDSDYYIANAAVRLNQKNADNLILNFVESYPTSTKQNSAFMDVGHYYFENSKYASAKKWYDKVAQNALTGIERDKFNFNYGYSFYATKNNKNAKKYLARVENSKKYGSQAKYYIGFMAYEGDDYNKASEYFDKVEDNKKYKDNLSYYQADLNFKLGNFEKAISLAKSKLKTSNAKEISELSKIIGESYFNLKQYAEAIPFLKKYKGRAGKWTNTDFYQLGYAYYKENKFDTAISEFNKIIDGNDVVAQNAYYHLGESYINLNKKQEALNAFRNASQMDYDLKIQEDAALNYAKISYEIGNPYKSVPQVLTEYLDKYPKTSYKQDIEILLVDSYITSKNYKDALALLEKNNSFESKVAYQKVAFYRGVELYNETKYLEAKALFNASLKEQRDTIYTAKATFWKAETDYNLTNYNEALLGFKAFKNNSKSTSTNEAANIDYNLGYTYFKQKKYSNAISFFDTYINTTTDKLRLNDAYLRLGDSEFASSNYTAAIKAYDKAIQLKKVTPDYAVFQRALSYGYAGESTKKIQGLNSFIETYKTSKLRDDALYELGNSYVKNNDTDSAMQTYNRLQTEYSESAFVPNVLLRQGLVHYNAENNDLALTKFKTIASKYPGSPEALQAVATSRLIYIDLGKVNEYATWVKSLNYIDVTNADLDNSNYEAAEKQYLAGSNSKAIKLFNQYLIEFKNGLHTTKAHFYLAQLYFKEGLQDTAIPHYQYIINKPKGEYTETALTRLSEINLNKKDWSTVIPILERLEQEGDLPQSIVFAQSNLMNAYYQLSNYTKAVTYAEQVLANSKIDNSIKSDAQIIIARSAFKTNNEQRAKTAYAQVEKIASGALAAEALYFNAYFKNKDKKYQASNTTIQKLAKDHSAHKYYGAKGLALMAKNFYELKDAYQATYILESIIDNFKEFEDIIAEAKETLSKIKTEQAKTNSSVETDDEN